MKYFVLSLFFFVIAACKKEYVPIFDPGTMEHGTISALLNGEDWLVSGQARYNTADSSLCNIYGSASDGYTFGFIFGFGIHNVPLKIGKYTLSGKETIDNNESSNPYAGVNISDDTPGDSYYLNNNRKSCVEITEVDTLNGHIKGKFEIYMVVEKPQVHTNFADKLCFKKGEFAVDLLP